MRTLFVCVVVLLASAYANAADTIAFEPPVPVSNPKATCQIYTVEISRDKVVDMKFNCMDSENTIVDTFHLSLSGSDFNTFASTNGLAAMQTWLINWAKANQGWTGAVE